jgi:ribosome-binding factor A
MEELVAQARAADEALAQAREGAQPAGDPDPYRVPAEALDEDDDEDSGGLGRRADAAGAEAGPGSGTGRGR